MKLYHQIFVVLSIALLISFQVLAYDCEVQVDKSEVALDESFLFRIIVKDAKQTFQIQLTEIAKSFQILSQEQSHQTYNVGSAFHQKTIYTLVLLPRAIGTFSIPSLQVGNKSTESLNIKVTKARPAATEEKWAFLETSLSKTTVFSNSELLYKVRLYIVENISPHGLHFEPPNFENVQHFKAPEYNIFLENRNGTLFKVYESIFSLFPEDIGKFTIDSPKVTGFLTIPIGNSNPFSMYRDMKRKVVNEFGDKVHFEVKDLPEKVKVKNIYPLKQLSLKELAHPKQKKIPLGQPLVQEYIVETEGFPYSHLKEPFFEDNDDYKIYVDVVHKEDTVSTTGIKGKIHYRVTYIPLKEGEIAFPSISYKWFNTESKQIQISRLQAIHIVAEQIAPPIFEESLEEFSKDSTYLLHQNYWFWSTLIFATLWIITLAYTIKIKSTTPAKTSIKNIKKSTRDLFHKIDISCKNNDVPGIQESILQYCQRTYPNIHTIFDVKEKISNKELHNLLSNIEKRLYSTDDSLEIESSEIIKILQSINSKKPLRKKHISVPTLNP